jgi:hypothetical protein
MILSQVTACDFVSTCDYDIIISFDKKWGDDSQDDQLKNGRATGIDVIKELVGCDGNKNRAAKTLCRSYPHLHAELSIVVRFNRSTYFMMMARQGSDKLSSC